MHASHLCRARRYTGGPHCTPCNSEHRMDDQLVCRVSVTPETMQVGDGMSSAADEQRNATDKL
eukprot:6355188-Prymnesium_polylepis.1